MPSPEPVEESVERLDAVTLEQGKKIYAEQLGGENGELVLVGDFDPEATLKAVSAWSGRSNRLRTDSLATIWFTVKCFPTSRRNSRVPVRRQVPGSFG